jgi:cytochrome c oxidase subunit II
MNQLPNLVRKKSPLLKEIPLNPPLRKGDFPGSFGSEGPTSPPLIKGGWGDFFCQKDLRRRVSSSKLGLLGLLVTCSLVLYGCAARPASGLSPQGTGAAQIANLWWIILALGVAVFVGVMALLLYALFRRRRGQAESESSSRRTWLMIVGGGIVLPVIVLLALFWLTLQTMVALSAPPSDAEFTIEVVGHQFWWEVKYPDQDFITANEIHIPVNKVVELRLTSIDVIHSFWVPSLQGKMDLIPGRTNTSWINAQETGTYRGICAEFCGLQHAHMQFLVIAQTQEEFDAWVENQRRPAREPFTELQKRGQGVFLSMTCISCHTIRGTPANGKAGPDLTHLASRRTLAAVMLENDFEHLAGWVASPQSIKPGVGMPEFDFEPGEFEPLIRYLNSLK